MIAKFSMKRKIKLFKIRETNLFNIVLGYFDKVYIGFFLYLTYFIIFLLFEISI